MDRLYDVTTLPKFFVDFVENFLIRVDRVGAMFFFPDTQELMPGIAHGDKNKINIEKFFKQKFNESDVVYIIRTAICQKHFLVELAKNEEWLERKENYRTVFIKKNLF